MGKIQSRDQAGNLIPIPKPVDDKYRPLSLTDGPFKTRFTMMRDQEILASNKMGPFATDVRRPYPGRTELELWVYRQWYRSKTKARIQPNRYKMYFARTLAGKQWSPYFDCLNAAATTYVVNGFTTTDALTSNKARERFINSMKDGCQASLGTSIAEWKQAASMVAKRAGQLLAGLRAARRLDPDGLHTALGIDVRQRTAKRNRESFRGKEFNVRDSSKDASNLWLEHHFGWSPLVQDMYDAVKVLASNPPARRITATASGTQEVKEGNFGSYSWTHRGVYSVKVRLGAHVTISNSNLAFFNQMGLINPASVAWEVVPFSFLVDWFIPVGKFLESYTDMLGYDVVYAFTTTLRECTVDSTYNQDSGPQGGTVKAASMSRELGLPPFRFVRPPFQGFSLARGATAVALVIQQFGSFSSNVLPSRHLR